jgi:hypothetical protein
MERNEQLIISSKGLLLKAAFIYCEDNIMEYLKEKQIINEILQKINLKKENEYIDNIINTEK